MEYSDEILRSVEGLPPYRPRSEFSGVLRHFGVSLADMVPRWEEGFRSFHPEAQFDDDLCKASGIIGVIAGTADLGASGRESVLTEFLSFGEKVKRMPAEIAVATGALDVAGGSYGLASSSTKATRSRVSASSSWTGSSGPRGRAASTRSAGTLTRPGMQARTFASGGSSAWTERGRTRRFRPTGSLRRV